MLLAHGVYVLGFAAGGLSTLSPCVLPLLPIVVGSALNAHRFGMLALAAGLALSFATIGIFIATAGFALGVDDGVFRVVAGVLIGAFGILLLSAHLQTRFAQALSGVEGRFGSVLARIGGQGMTGQFLIGLMLGAVWSPCSGPTLGSAALLASRQSHLPQAALTMLMFGLGASVPLMVVGSLSREMLKRWRGRLTLTGQRGRWAMGGLMLVVSVLVLSGWDKSLETAFVVRAPNWLTSVSSLI